MKIVHFSDTHLGFNDLDVINEENVNQREADFYDVFSQMVKQIKQIKPDYIIHTGDLFHRTSPSNRAITFALEQFKIINSLNIPFVLIAGNHSTPRTNLSSPILKIFENFENIYVSYDQQYKKVEFEDIVFHCLPHMNDDTKALSQIELCEEGIVENKKNIMMMHCSVGAWYLMQEFGEWVYPTSKEYIFEKMDYVALGHWHGFGKVGKHENVYYSGSLERTSLNDKRNSKGFSLVTLEDKLNVEYKEIQIRPILEFKIDCENLEESIKELDLSNIKDTICDVKLLNLTTIQSIDINNADIKNIFKEALYISLKREFKISNNEKSIDDIESLSLEDYFIEHIKEDSKTEEFDRLKLKVQELFSAYEEANSDTL
ncbi:metallophosphoesterase family protein [Aliarcobacter butzleri]|uniref:metallophosphoesterase family protein n=1 Tax=Aliarcobacter butzleri TaxID=28197 RepID=UPI000229595B|nr:exonuclease SbcCD subunit D [Aliarcobacter butzleri]BAK71260.1 metallophosphoesterase [Aliarcobacter butzleri ED-1]